MTEKEMNEKGSILIVDDDAGIRETLSLVFEKNGFEPETAGTGQEAIDKTLRRFFNVAIIDIRLPDVEGIELLTLLKEMHPDMAVIMVTAYASIDTALRALNEGASAYITKPMNMNEVLATVRDALGKQRLLEEKRQAEEALRESEHKYRLLFESTLDGVFVIDAETTKIVLANQAAAKMYGFDSVEDMVEVDLLSFILPEDRERAIRIIVEDMFEKDLRQVNEFRTITKDGREVWISALGVRTEYQGRLAGLISVRDVTETKKSEQQLRESEEVYRTLVETAGRAGEGILITQNIEGREAVIVFANGEALRVTGYAEEELLGKTLQDIVYPDSFSMVLDYYRRKQEEEEVPGRFEVWLRQKDGAPLPIEVSVGMATYHGKVASIAYVRDITERKQAEEDLITSERLASIGRLASGVAHELNNPLTSVIGFSQLLLEKDIPNDIREDIEIIYSEAQRTSAVVKNLLTFARKRAPEKQLVDINGIVEKTLELCAYEQRVSNIKINTQFAPDLPQIMADYFQLQQVFLNIIINAEHSMIEAHNGGTLTITTERIGDVIKASFADDGLGISKENLGHMFEPFFTTKEVGKGTGLGLSICHKIVTEHGGEIYAESELGQGATLIVELPIS